MKTLLAATAFAVALSSSVFAGQSGPAGSTFTDWVTGLERERESTVGCYFVKTSQDQIADGVPTPLSLASALSPTAKTPHWHVMTIASAGNNLNEFNTAKALLTVAFLQAPAFIQFTLTGKTVCGGFPEVSSVLGGFG